MLRQQTTNGFTTLTQLDGRLQSMRQNLHEMELNAEQYSQQIAEIGNQESGIYADLAALSLSKLDNADGVRQTLSRAERQAQEMLQKREKAMHTLVVETEQSLMLQKQLEQAREKQSQSLQNLGEKLHALVESTHAALALNDEYKLLQERAQTAVDTVEAAEIKAERSANEHRQKAGLYEQDDIFMYLWRRAYGTKDYRAGRLTRLFDRWVAMHVGFEEQRQNYYMLQEIPKRLEAHVESLRLAAQEAMAALETMEQTAEEENGVRAIEQEMAQLEDELALADEAIEKEEIHYHQCLQQRDLYARAEDTLYQRALAALAEGLKSQSLEQLRHRAERTSGYEDDSLVGQLAELQQEQRSVAQTHRTAQRASSDFRKRLSALESIRKNFKRQSFDAPHSQFTDAAAVATAMDDFTRGLITSRELWRLIERSQRFIRRRTYPNYGRRPGAMRMPRGIRIPSNWGGMGGGGRGGGFRFPSGGGGGGGFKTGGGF